MLILACIAVVLRLIARFLQGAKFWWDDACNIIALVRFPIHFSLHTFLFLYLAYFGRSAVSLSRLLLLQVFCPSFLPSDLLGIDEQHSERPRGWV
jgi:hypothetical protein